MDNVNMFVAAGVDEFGCFHISDFQVGNAILVQSDEGKIRGLVTEVIPKSGTIFFRSRSGDGVCNINDVAFLSDSERGWISNGQ